MSKTLWNCLRIVLVMSTVFCGSLASQRAAVTRNVNLRTTASTIHDPKQMLVPPDTVTLISKKQTNGYYHVRTEHSGMGWVWARNVAVIAGDSGGATPPNPGGPPLPPPGTFAIVNASCPAVGTHLVAGVATSFRDTTDMGLRNLAKRHIPVGAKPVTLTLATFLELQRDVNTRFIDAHDEKTPFHPNRSALMHRPTSAGTVGEGDLVQIAAYLTKIRPQKAETVNCGGKDGNDIHINVGAKNSTEWEGIVVEMIPQLGRVDGWNDSALNKVAAAKLQVLVVGGLTYDNEHLVDDDSLHVKPSQPHRISLWEIHPVTAFFVCEVATCDPANHATWTTLSAWAKAHPH